MVTNYSPLSDFPKKVGPHIFFLNFTYRSYRISVDWTYSRLNKITDMNCELNRDFVFMSAREKETNLVGRSSSPVLEFNHLLKGSRLS